MIDSTHCLGRTLCFAAAITMVASALTQIEARQRILVAPNVLVSRDGPTPKVEFHLAAHPRDAKTLLASAVVFEPEATCRLYLSSDGGWTWRSRDFPELREQGCTDPQVAFGQNGTGYFAVMTFLRNQLQQKRSVVSLYRSEDQGRFWHGPVYVGLGESPDHPQLAVYARAGEPDRVYLGVNGTDGVALYRSEDGGRTFSTPHVVVRRDGRAVFNINTLVLSDGTIVVPYTDAEVADPAKLTTVNIFVKTSSDAGRTFSEARPVARQRRAPENPLSLRSLPQTFAADVRSPRFLNRLYCVWMDFATGRSRLLHSASSDRGNTWAPPKALVPDEPLSSDQFRPAVSVAPNGMVGASWFDNREGERTYAQYFAISVDGGQSFAPAVRVSSELSPTDASGHQLWRPSPNSPSISRGGDHTFIFGTVGGTFPDGGDYVGLAASADNVFHPFWPDSRTGTYQMWTARVAVGGERPPAVTPLDAESLNRSLRPVFDPVASASSSDTIEIPIRIQNVSKTAVCGPLYAVIAGTMFDAEAPVVLNAANGKPWAGAAFDYSRAFGDFKCLGAGEISNPVIWHIRTVRRHIDAGIPTFFRIRFSRAP